MGSPSVNLEMDHNVAYHCNWTYSAASGGSGNTDGLSVHDNEGYDWANWDDLVNNSQHHNGFHLFMLDGTGVLTNLRVYNNYFHGTTGVTTTAQIFIESPGGPPSGSLTTITGAVFNNLLVQTAAGSNWSNGMIAASNVSTTSHITLQVYNNTFYASAAAGQAISALFTPARTTVTFENNILSNARIGYGTGGSFTADYNIYYMSSFNWDGAIGGANPFASWQGYCGCDAHSRNGADPLLSTTTFVPGAGSPAVGFGTNLTSLGIAALNKDRNGNTRSSAGAWTVGAYEASGTVSDLPAPPTGLVALVQ
jgi:hypothetical protein